MSYVLTAAVRSTGAGAAALTVVIAALPPEPAAVVLAALLSLEPLDELPVPLNEIVSASFASLKVKSDCTVSETVPTVAFAVR